MRAPIFHVLLCGMLSSWLHAGARIDLRPDPPVPEGGYAANTVVRVDAYMVDTGNLQGNISFRGVFLDFSDSPPWGGAPGTLSYPENIFEWQMGPKCHLCPGLPLTGWVYPLTTPIPSFMITLPDNGEVLLGHVLVDVGAEGGLLDVMNDDEPNVNYGAQAVFGFGGAGDPVTTWRSYTGELTGGVLELPVVPEPGTLSVLGVMLGFVAARYRK